MSDTSILHESAGSDISRIKVLVVDDDAALCDLTASYLEKLDEDIQVLTVTAPSTALNIVRDETVDCVVTDYDMPEMNGIELLKRIHEEYPNLPVILFTGKGSEEIATEAISAGVTDYLQKGGNEVYELLLNRIQNAVDQHRAKRRARINQDRLLDLYEQTDGLFIVDSEWTVTYWNQQMTVQTGRQPEQTIGEPFWEIFPELVGTALEEEYTTAMETQSSTTFETYFENGDYWVEARVYPDNEGGLFIHSRDITLWKEREHEMYQRNNQLEAFANTLSHDLQNPLQVAEGHLELAKQEDDIEHLEAVADAHNRMRDLVSDLLKFARNQTNLLELESLSLQETATTAWGMVSAPTATLSVEQNICLRADETQLTRIMENLFQNAIDHAGSDVTINVGVLDDESGFFVEDDGPGIPESKREEVRQPGVTSNADGTGFGLSIVAQIVEKHEWDLSITTAESGGARFEVTDVELTR